MVVGWTLRPLSLLFGIREFRLIRANPHNCLVEQGGASHAGTLCGLTGESFLIAYMLSIENGPDSFRYQCFYFCSSKEGQCTSSGAAALLGEEN